MSKTYDQDNADGSLTAYAQYLHQVRWTPKLTLEEEKHLFRCLERGKVERSQCCPDAAVLADVRQARDRLVQGYQPLVIHLARRFMREHRGDSMDIMDFIQEANLALLSAIEDNDGTCHDSLKPFAIVCICYRLRRVLATTGMMFRLPENKLHEIKGVRRAHSELRGVLGRDPLVAEIAAHLRLDEKKVSALMVTDTQRQVLSLDVPLTDEGDRFLSDVLPTETVLPAPASEDADGASFGLRVERWLSVLTPRQQEMFVKCYGLDGGRRRTYTEVAAMFDLSYSTIAVHLERAKLKLQQVMVAPVPAVSVSAHAQRQARCASDIEPIIA
jgi:RNA polymerase sigma factor (sigma-70 family)